MSKNNARDKELMKQSETECGFDPDKFADLIRADEREACAKMVEGLFDDPNDSVLEFIVDAIRLRNNT